MRTSHWHGPVKVTATSGGSGARALVPLLLLGTPARAASVISLVTGSRSSLHPDSHRLSRGQPASPTPPVARRVTPAVGRVRSARGPP